MRINLIFLLFFRGRGDLAEYENSSAEESICLNSSGSEIDFMTYMTIPLGKQPPPKGKAVRLQ